MASTKAPEAVLGDDTKSRNGPISFRLYLLPSETEFMGGIVQEGLCHGLSNSRSRKENVSERLRRFKIQLPEHYGALREAHCR